MNSDTKIKGFFQTKALRLRMAAYIFTACAALAGLTASAEELTWVSGSTDWSAPGSYVQNKKPEPGDVVLVPSGVSAMVAVTSTEEANTEGSSFDVFSKLGSVKTEDATSSVVLDIAEGASVTNFCCIMGKTQGKGTIVKRGKGTIEFGNQELDHAYDLDINVESGELALPQERPTGNTTYVQKITVSKGAKLVTAMNSARSDSSNASPTYCMEIWGDGAIISRYNKSQFFGFREDGRTFTFSGTFSKGVRFNANENVTVLLTGAGSKMNDTVEANSRATIGFAKLGMKADGSSTFGTDDFVYWRGMSGTFLYLGNGETSDKDFSIYSVQNVEHILDGGSAGNLTLTGSLKFRDGSGSASMQRVTLTGSNTRPCIFDGAISNLTHNGVNYYMHITKKGSGTWRFTDKERAHPNAWTVEDGTLQFASLKESGVECSLGTATNLFESYSGAVDESKRVDWAFALGGADTRGVMEYVGNTDVSCSTRPIALKGMGGALKNSTGRPVIFSGVSAASGAESAVFEVSGDNPAVTNFINDVTDGEGRTSFVKNGSGTWMLGGRTDFSGSLTVGNGTLLVRDPTKYTWFRLTVTGNFESGSRAQMRELGIYDGSGRRMNGFLKPFTNYYGRVEGVLPEGMCSYWRGGTLSDSIGDKFYPIEALFSDTSEDAAPAFKTNGVYVMMSPDVSSSWLPIVMHLTNGMGRAAAFDIALPKGSKSPLNVKSFFMEGSVDGIHWDKLKNVVLENNVDGNRWAGNGKLYNANYPAETHAGGWPIAGGPETAELALRNVSSISVAAGARLVAWGGTAPIKGLSVDANGAGTIDGFEFAEKGTLNIENLPKGGVRLPGTYLNCTGFGNIAKWALSVDGEESTDVRAIVSGDAIRIVPAGFTISIR